MPYTRIMIKTEIPVRRELELKLAQDKDSDSDTGYGG